MTMSDHKKLRNKLIGTLIFLIPIGFYSKFYDGPLDTWVNNSLGGLFYVVFWTLLLRLLYPRVNSLKIIIIVLVVTCTLEFTQLLNLKVLEMIRSTFLGRTLIGNSFHWSDMLYYVLGSGVSFIWINYLEGEIIR